MAIVVMIIALFMLQAVQVNTFIHFWCSIYPDNRKCTDAKTTEIKFYKSDSSEYKKCPDAISCFESGSEIYLNTSDNNGLYLEAYSILNVFENASLQVVNEKGFCKIAGRGFLALHGSLIINSGHFSVFASAEVVNYGKIELSEGSTFNVMKNSLVKISPNGRVSMGRHSQLKMFSSSILEVSKMFDDKPSQEIIMKNGAVINMPYMSLLRITSGDFVMMENAYININIQGRLDIDGHLELEKGAKIHIYTQAELQLGYVESQGVTKGDANCSLIFTEESKGISVTYNTRLVVKKGAHCFVKTYVILRNDTVLEDSTKTDDFECYQNRNDLNEALLQFKKNGTTPS